MENEDSCVENDDCLQQEDIALKDLGWCGELLGSEDGSGGSEDDGSGGDCAAVRGVVAAAVGSLSPSFAQRISGCMEQLNLDATAGTILNVNEALQ